MLLDQHLLKVQQLVWMRFRPGPVRPVNLFHTKLGNCFFMKQLCVLMKQEQDELESSDVTVDLLLLITR